MTIISKKQNSRFFCSFEIFFLDVLDHTGEQYYNLLNTNAFTTSSIILGWEDVSLYLSGMNNLNMMKQCL